MKAAKQSPPRRRAVAGAESGRIQIRKILVPIDFSKPSRDAIKFALPWVKLFGAQLHLAHVIPSDYPLVSLSEIPVVHSLIEDGPSVRRRLQELSDSFGIKLPRGNTHQRRGRASEEICELARELKVDLIVTSTRGNAGLKHLVLGSTAERIVRYSPCPVLVVRGKPPRVAAPKKIIVPIDFSPCSMQGLRYAKGLAHQFEATLLPLNSVDLTYYVTADEYARYDFPRLLDQSQKAAAAQMRDLVGKTEWNGVRVDPLLEVGHAGQQICDRAADHRADMIVTSTHGKTGLKHAFLGSTAEYVVRHATCPVLVVPSHLRPAVATKGQGKLGKGRALAALIAIVLAFTASAGPSMAAGGKAKAEARSVESLTYANVVSHFRQAHLRATEVQQRCTIFFEGEFKNPQIYDYCVIMVENSDQDVQVTFYLTDAHEMNWITEFLDAPFFSRSETQKLFGMLNSKRDVRGARVGRFRVDFHWWQPRHAEIIAFSFTKRMSDSR